MTQQQLALSPEARTGRLVEKTASFAESGYDFLEMVKDIVRTSAIVASNSAMKETFLTVLAAGLIVSVGTAEAQQSKADHGGFIGGLLGVGIGLNGQIGSGTAAYADTSLLFAIRGGLLLGKDSRWLLGLEVAPTTNRLDWRRAPTATGFVSFGSLVPIRNSREWSWLWKVGFGVGGGYDYRFLVGAQLDVLTFNYKMNDRLWVDLGIPTVRFHIEINDMALYNVQFVFPLGVTFAI